MKLSQSNQRKKARLEIIPLIDIMFFLVATFMMVSLSMIKNQGVDVNLPVASSSSEVERQQTATISITNDNQVFFNKEEVNPDRLRLLVKEFRLESPKGAIILNSDRHSTMEKSIEILDILRLMGVTGVAIQTQLPPE